MIVRLFNEIIKIFHSEHPFYLFISDVIEWLSYIWNYRVFETTDKQPIAIANITIGLILFFIGLRCAKSLSMWTSNKISYRISGDKNAVKSLERISYYIFTMIMVIFVLDVINVPLTAFTVVGTTLALGVGLGSQNIANNFISGIIIMVEKPIKLGDIIEVKNLNVVGKVINIGARCISLKTENNINILIPNSNILQDSVINWTLEDPELKIDLNLWIQRTASIEKIDELVNQVLNANASILKIPAPLLLLKEILHDSLHYEIEFWVNLNHDINNKYIINDINRALEPLFRSHGILLAEKPS